jgi:hypothetical protein
MMPWWAWYISSFCLFVFQRTIADAIKMNPDSRILKLVRALLIVAMLLAIVAGTMQLTRH